MNFNHPNRNLRKGLLHLKVTKFCCPALFLRMRYQGCYQETGTATTQTQNACIWRRWGHWELPVWSPSTVLSKTSKIIVCFWLWWSKVRWFTRFEESLKKAAAKKAEAPKAPKTLDYFFSSPKAEKQSKKEGRKEVAVDDFFASSLSSKVGSAILVIHSRLLHERKPLLWSPRHRRL